MIRERHLRAKKRIELIEYYKHLQSLQDGMTPQKRGQLFNDFISKILNEHGWKAQPNYRKGTGEIDVVFEIRHTRYILEAKWEQNAINEDPIAKLSNRVKQRLAGTVGVIISMSGYTKPAIKNITKGQRLEILLLEKEHLEAMIYGLASPELIFENIINNAHFNGKPLTPLAKLSYTTIPKENLIWSFNDPNSFEVNKGFEIKPVLKITETRSDSLLNYSKDHGLITESDGFPVSINFAKETISSLVGISNGGFFPINKKEYYLKRNNCICKYGNKKWEFPILPNDSFHHKILTNDSENAFVLIFSRDENDSISLAKPNKLLDINNNKTVQLEHYFFNICCTLKGTFIGISPITNDYKKFSVIEFDESGKSIKTIVNLSSWNPRISMVNENEIYVMSDNDIKLVNLDTSEVLTVIKSSIETGYGSALNITQKSNDTSYFSGYEYKDSVRIARIIYELKKK